MDTLYIVCGSTLFFGTICLIVFGFFAYLRYLRHKEMVAMIEKGIIQAPLETNSKSTLTWGIAITALGLALCAGLYPLGWLISPNDFPLNFGPWMLVGLMPTFFGLGLILIYLVTRSKEPKKKDKVQTSEDIQPVE